jgi:hypothetical protein
VVVVAAVAAAAAGGQILDGGRVVVRRKKRRRELWGMGDIYILERSLSFVRFASFAYRFQWNLAARNDDDAMRLTMQ